MSVQTRKRKLNRLGKCDVCRATNAIYTCPRCEAATCSLNCVKRHKKDLDCDGVRVRTKYVPVDKMNENNLLSDYRLLEDVRRCVDIAEWGRESVEQPQQVIADSSSDNVKQSSDKNTESTVECSEKNHKNSEKTSKQPKQKNVQVSKSDILLARSNRIKNHILNRQGKATKKADDGTNGLLKANENCDNINDVKEESSKENTSSTEGSSSGSSTTGETTSDEDCEDSVIGNSEIESVTPLEVPPTADEHPPEVKQVNHSNTGSNERTLTKEEFSRKKKSELLKAIALGGKKKAMTMESLTNAAYSRGISLSCLPDKFEKHWENTSFFFSNEDCIYWHLKISFINANFYTLSLNEVAETMTLSDIVKGCIRRSEEYWKQQSKAGDDPLLVYRMMDFTKIGVLMAADKVPNNQRKFYILDMSKSLRENFVGKCIVEFPQLCIIIEDCHVVATVHEKFGQNFFGEVADLERDKDEEPKNEFEKVMKKKMEMKKKRSVEKKNRPRHHDDNSDRESGELTDSSSSDNFFSDSDSEEELFKESEFRSVYKDLLSTFEIDVNQLQPRK